MNIDLGSTVVLIIALILVILVLWWFFSLESVSVGIPPENSSNFQDMWADFRSKDKDLWMSDSKRRLGVELSNSKYRYRIIKSDYELFYDNRSNNSDKSSRLNSMETVVAGSNGSMSLIRDGKRNLAIRVSDNKPRYRIVHIQSLDDGI